jgi:hypothetical protein
LAKADSRLRLSKGRSAMVIGWIATLSPLSSASDQPGADGRGWASLAARICLDIAALLDKPERASGMSSPRCPRAAISRTKSARNICSSSAFRLMQLSGKAGENGEKYALLTPKTPPRPCGAGPPSAN